MSIFDKRQDVNILIYDGHPMDIRDIWTLNESKKDALEKTTAIRLLFKIILYMRIEYYKYSRLFYGAPELLN